MDTEVLMGTKDAAAFLGVQPGTLAWWRHSGMGPRWGRIGPRRVVYKRSELARFIEAGFESRESA